MITVVYLPGTVEHIHRHDAYAFVYVLEGSIIEGVRGGKEVTLTPGQTFALAGLARHLPRPKCQSAHESTLARNT